MGPEPVGFEVGEFEQGLGELQLGQKFECVRVERVAAEVTVEVPVAFEHCDIDAGSGEEMSEDHAARSATDDDAIGGDHLRSAAAESMQAEAGLAVNGRLSPTQSASELWVGGQVLRDLRSGGRRLLIGQLLSDRTGADRHWPFVVRAD